LNDLSDRPELGSAGGALVVAKTCAILREIARAGSGGARLADLSRNTGLSRPSVHRILATLKAEDFVRQSDSRRYRLTPQVHEIGLSAPGVTGNLEALRPVIQQLSDESGDTVYLSMRSGSNSHYLMRGEGSYPIRTYVVKPFQVLPMVSCHSGRALLGSMPRQEADEIIGRAWSDDPGQFKAATRDSLREEIEFVRENGYGWARDVTFEGVAGLTRAVPNANGPGYLAVTISAVSPRLPLDRARDLLPKLIEITSRIRQIIDNLQI
jgi:DNA-binding IclR family transcriptional regulator